MLSVCEGELSVGERKAECVEGRLLSVCEGEGGRVKCGRERGKESVWKGEFVKGVGVWNGECVESMRVCV